MKIQYVIAALFGIALGFTGLPGYMQLVLLLLFSLFGLSFALDAYKDNGDKNE